MKKLILLPVLFIVTLPCFCQTSKTWCLAPSCKQTITTSDSATVFAQLTASDGFKGITWGQLGGPAIAIPPAAVIWSTGLQAQSAFTLRNLAPGTYIFAATGISSSGITGSVTDTLQVNAAIRKLAYVITVYSDSTKTVIK